MNSFLSGILDLISSGEGSGFLIILFFKGSIILLFASVINFFLRRNSAAVRHWVWCLAFSSVLLVRPLSILLPEKPLRADLYLNSSG